MQKLGVVTDWDYILYVPIRYEDRTKITPISQLAEGVDAYVEATVVRKDFQPFNRSLLVQVEDETGELDVRFLRCYPGVSTLFPVGGKVRLFGRPTKNTRRDSYIFFHPQITGEDKFEELPKALTPIYRIAGNVTQSWLRKRIQQAFLYVDVNDLLNEEELNKLGLPALLPSLRALHYPEPDADLEALQARLTPEWRRIKFDELFAQQLTLMLSRKHRQASAGPVITVPEDKENSITARLYRSLPFSLTNAQKRVWREILESMAGPKPMNRLVQGDVGSGKTIIAAMAAAIAIDNGWQVAFMAPTEILAEQHFNKIIEWLEPFGVKTVWLAGKLKAKERRVAIGRIAGDADIIVGTHALFQKDVKYRKLGLAIVDEQHRFGVEQRLALMSGSEEKSCIPHLLMLSATPIPRTLALSYLADLDVSSIDELPPGRKPITTKIFRIDKKQQIADGIKVELLSGKQAYWVCPLIEESEKLDLSAAQETFEQLREYMGDVRIELLHGRQAPEEKQAIMDRFKSGETSLLVSTTVIEVGVDVPNASFMVIEHAERFGLSQLHQLRGRVGRGSNQSYCIALYGENLSKIGSERLKIFRETQDGFKIAKRDLELRGPGEFLGARQSGMAMLRFADIRADEDLLKEAIFLAHEWTANNDPRAEVHAKRWFQSREDYLKA